MLCRNKAKDTGHIDHKVTHNLFSRNPSPSFPSFPPQGKYGNFDLCQLPPSSFLLPRHSVMKALAPSFRLRSWGRFPLRILPPSLSLSLSLSLSSVTLALVFFPLFLLRFPQRRRRRRRGWGEWPGGGGPFLFSLSKPQCGGDRRLARIQDRNQHHPQLSFSKTLAPPHLIFKILFGLSFLTSTLDLFLFLKKQKACVGGWLCLLL